jgi:uncharacterized protein involved in tellurium resistance
MELKQKVILKQKGESADIPVQNLLATLSWTAAVDLDLYAIYRAKQTVKPRGGFFGFGGVKPAQEGKVYFGSRGNLKDFPWMALDKDAGVGDVGGQNQENLRIADLTEMEYVLIAVNIFNKPTANFVSYDGRVTLKADNGDEVEVPLTATTGGNWCVIAQIDNSRKGARLINVNKVQSKEPVMGELV